MWDPALAEDNLISAHPDVKILAVIGMPDPEMGERICGYIQSKPGTDLSFEKVINFLKSKGASVLHLPERIEFIKPMPLTRVGKLDKRALREDIKKKLKQDKVSFD